MAGAAIEAVGENLSLKGIGGKLGFGSKSGASAAAAAGAAAAGNGDDDGLGLNNYQQPGKKATTILSPHLETLSTGSMFIQLENASQSHPINQPLKGVIKVNLKEAFDAKSVTLSICGFQRSHFTAAGGQGDQFGKTGVPSVTRLVKTNLNVNYTVANFAEGEMQNGQSEFPFSLVIPDSVKQSVML